MPYTGTDAKSLQSFGNNYIQIGKSVKERGKLKKTSRKASVQKIDTKKLIEYVKANPDAYLHEIASVSKCSSTAIRKSLKS